MNADGSVFSGRRLIHLVSDGHEALHRIDFFGVHRRSSAANRFSQVDCIARLATLRDAGEGGAQLMRFGT
jgi:hypothetical protein